MSGLPLNTDAMERTRPATTDASLDDIADAVVRATARGNTARPILANESSVTASPDNAIPPVRRDSADLPLQRTYLVAEGTVIDTVLTNRLDGSAASPVNCLVTNAVYSLGQLPQVLIPSGSRILGSTRRPRAGVRLGSQLASIALSFPDGTTVTLEQFSD